MNISSPDSRLNAHRRKAHRTRVAPACLAVVPLVALSLDAGSFERTSAEEPERAVVETTATTATAASTSEQAAFADALAGRYRWTGAASERAAVEQAIDAVVSEMSMFVRGAARSRLRDANQIPAAIGITRKGDHLEIAFDQRKYRGPLDGSEVKVVGMTGEALRHHIEVGEFGLLQSFRGDAGRRRNALKRHGDDDLVVIVEIESDQLPKRLSYRLTFERVK